MSHERNGGIRSTTRLLESQVGRLVLAGGASVDIPGVGKEWAKIVDASCFCKVCNSCLMESPSSGRTSPIEVVKESGVEAPVSPTGLLHPWNG